MADIRWILAANLTQMRKETGMTKTQVAERAGLHKTTISRMEFGEGNAPLLTLEAVAVALGVELHQLLSPAPPPTLKPGAPSRAPDPASPSPPGHARRERGQEIPMDRHRELHDEILVLLRDSSDRIPEGLARELDHIAGQLAGGERLDALALQEARRKLSVAEIMARDPPRWTWLTARNNAGTKACCLTITTQEAFQAYSDETDGRGWIRSHQIRPVGHHWDGGRMTEAEIAALRARGGRL